jgi:TolB-like protein
MKFIDELKRRNVIKATIAYIVVSWVLLQFFEIVLPHLESPPWVLKTLMFVITIGFPIWIIFSWVYEFTPEGFKKTINISKEKSITAATNKRLNIIIIIALVIAIGVSFVNKPMSDTSSKTIVNNDLISVNSIAVIPFKNLSDNKENQYFADGMMDDILNHLSSIQALEVKSRLSSERYRDSNKSSYEIGKELGVSYILEGSVQMHKDSIRFIVQLVDAINDNHLWSDKYDFKLKNIFAIQSEISKQIAVKLNTAIPRIGIGENEKRLTENIEAYNLYLKGRFFWHLRTEKDLNISIYYYKKALELDSIYALAYAGLADSYFIKAWRGWIEKNEGLEKGKEFAQKALTINNNIAEAHATLGGIKTYYEWKWKEAESELKLAISLNPNDAVSHQYYSELLDILGRNEEAREQIDLALELNPYSSIMNSLSALYYYNSNDYYKSIDAHKRAKHLANSNNDYDKLHLIRCFLNLGKNKEALELIKDVISIDNHQLLDKILMESGIKGVINWFIDYILVNKQNSDLNFHIARFYSLIGDSQNALKYLEYFFEEGHITLPRINNSSEFSFIRTEPRFIALLNKMNLVDYQ